MTSPSAQLLGPASFHVVISSPLVIAENIPGSINGVMILPSHFVKLLQIKLDADIGTGVKRFSGMELWRPYLTIEQILRSIGAETERLI